MPYIVERTIYDDPATRNCRAEKYRQCAIQFTVLNFRHWLTGNWSDAFATIYSECRFPEFARVSARYASAALFVKRRNYVTSLPSDFRRTFPDVNREREENFQRQKNSVRNKNREVISQTKFSNLNWRSIFHRVFSFVHRERDLLFSILITRKLLGNLFLYRD